MDQRTKPSARLDPLPPDPALKDEFERSRRSLGFVPNSMLIMQRKPNMVKAWSQVSSAMWAPDSTVDRGLKRLIAHVSSRASGCRYCMAHTAGGAIHLGVDEPKLAAVWDYQTSPLYSAAERAALDLALAAGSVPNAVTEEMFAELRKYWTEEQIVEIVFVISAFGFLNRWNDTMGTPLEEEPNAVGERFLSSHGWSPGKHGRHKN
jgi:uncharacterized peroxidase-related enzyme